MKLSIRVTPNAKRDEILGWKGDVLRVKVSAPPVDGKANAALIELLAEALGIAKSAITIIAGVAARSKVIELTGADPEETHRRLARGQSSLLP